MRVYSDFTQKYYEKEEAVPVKIVKQAGLYIKYGVRPVDLFWDDDENCLVFMFSKKETKDLFQMWKSYCLE